MDNLFQLCSGNVCDPIPVFDALVVLASSQAVQNGLLTQQRVNRSGTGLRGFHLWPHSKERVPYDMQPPCFATTALLPWEHVAQNTACLERDREGVKWWLESGLSLPIFLQLKFAH